MTGSTGTPTGPNKPRTAAKVITPDTDKAAAATTETNRPSAEKVLESSTEEAGAPTPAGKSSVNPATGAGSLDTSPGTGSSAALAASTSTPSPATTGAGTAGTGSGSLYSAGPGSSGIGGTAEPSRTTLTSGDTSILRSNPADTPAAGTPSPESRDSVTDTAAEYGREAGQRVAQEYRRRTEQISETAGQLKETASRAADQARRQSQRGLDMAQSAVQQNPMVTVAVALGVGVLVGALLAQSGRGSGSQGGYRRDRSGPRRQELDPDYRNYTDPQGAGRYSRDPDQEWYE
jgi:ElaB/YqjD/DUF883 family membrane-anchored ribosome-binding protein